MPDPGEILLGYRKSVLTREMDVMTTTIMVIIVLYLDHVGENNLKKLYIFSSVISNNFVSCLISK